MNELFSKEEVSKDSPRLAWLKKHQIVTYFCEHLDPEECPWCAWIGEKDNPPEDPELCGYGLTEGDAIVALCKANGIKLWNEEEPNE